MRGTARQSAGDWQFAVDVSSARGQAYAQPIFLDFGAHALRASAAGRFRAGRGADLERFTVDHAQVAQASGRASFDFENEQPLRTLTLHLAGLAVSGAYESYLQPLLLDTNFKAMQTAGSIAGEIEVVDGAPRSVDLVLEDLTFDDGARTFAMEALAGAVHWRSDPQAKSDDSTLRWNAGAILGLAIGASELQFNGSGRQFRLLQPARIPLLDGALALESLRHSQRRVCRASRSWSMRRWSRSSVRQLCQAFGWPEFGGSIGGTHFQAAHARRRRDTRHDAAVHKCSTATSGSAICGWSSRSGKWPRFYSNVALDNLDLELDDGRVLVRAHHGPLVRPHQRPASCSIGRRWRSTRGFTRRRTIARNIGSASARWRTSAASAAAAPA